MSRLALALMTSMLLAACSGGSSSSSVSSEVLLKDVFPTSGDSLAWSLKATNATELKNYFEKAVTAADKVQIIPPAVPAVGVPVASAPGVSNTTSTSTAATTSQTTLQEAGVDEADLVKADATYVYSIDPLPNNAGRSLLNRQKLSTNSSSPNLTPSDSYKLGFSKGVDGTSLYLDADRNQIAAIGTQSSGWFYSTMPAKDWFVPTSWRNGATEILIVNAPASGSMKQTRQIKLGGHLIGSRKIGATLYIVLRSYPQVLSADSSALKATDYLPTISLDGAAELPLVDPASCLLQSGNVSSSADVITLVAIGLTADKHSHNARCFTGSTEAFYMSEQNIYLATTRTSYSMSGTVPQYSAQTSTDIHKFAFQGLNMAYRGSGNVKGHLGFDQNRKSFRMGEFKGALHVITETRASWFFPTMVNVPIATPIAGGVPIPPVAAITPVAPIITNESSESPGKLSVLQEKLGSLALVGELPNAKRPEPLGKPGERLYASRLMGNKGYLVTYRLTDPLYVLDLSDPTDPKVAGSLEVSGYSDYLFPLNDSLLLGVGKDAAADGTLGDGRMAWYQGVKVALIDISQPSKPIEADRLIIGKRGTDATVLQDHHGIAIQIANGQAKVAMPVKVHQTPTPYTYGVPSDYYGFTRNETAKFEINLSQKKIITKNSLPSSLKSERWIGNDRALIYLDQVHYYQDGVWISASW
jgi:uncharacterized secreted protein with C-terminal beta-propeller domain